MKPKTEIVDAIKNYNKEILTLNIEKDIIQPDSEGNSDFINLNEPLTALKQVASYLEKVELRFMPYRFLEQLETNYKIMSEGLKALPQSRKSDFVNNETVDGLTTKFYNLLASVLRIQAYSKCIEDQISDKSEAQSLVYELQQLSIEAKQKIDVISKFTQQAGIATYANIYSSISTKEGNAAIKWLAGTISVILITIVSAFLLLTYQADESIPKFDIIQFTVTKLVIISSLFLTISLFIKNYRAHKHNQIVNQHRANALVTFDALVKTQKDDATRNAVLTAVTNTIFGNLSTGYNTQDSLSSDFYSKVLDIISKNRQ